MDWCLQETHYSNGLMFTRNAFVSKQWEKWPDKFESKSSFSNSWANSCVLQEDTLTLNPFIVPNHMAVQNGPILAIEITLNDEIYV